MKLSKLGYLLKEGFISIFAHGFMSFASVTIIVACLMVMGSFSMLAININALIAKAESDNEILAFIDDAVGEDQARALQPKFDAILNISQALFVTREEAMESYARQFDDSTLFEDVEADVLRHRYVVYLEDISLMEQTQNDIMSIDGVIKVRADLEISRGFVMVRNVVSAVSLILVVLLLIISIFIMSNTIKLTTFGRREEIAIMKMVGATNGFIRFPFVVEGLILGLVGSGVAYLLQWGVYSLVSEKIMQSLVSNFVDVVDFSFFMYPMLIVFLIIGFIVGTFGGVIAIRNYLKV